MKRWMVFALVVIGVLSFPAVLLARGAEGGKVVGMADEPLFLECQDHFYNGEYSRAKRCFSRYIALDPDDSRGYWREAYATYFQLKAEQKTTFPVLGKNARDKFLGMINKGIAETDRGIEARDNVKFELYVQACLLSMRGGIEARNVGWFTARATLKLVLSTAARSKYQDAEYLIGLTNYNGASHSIVFFLAGLPHKRNLGLAELLAATVKNNGPYVDDIWFAIFGIAAGNIEDGTEIKKPALNKEATKKIAETLARKYPRNKALREYLARYCR